jgi:hypothetical protein
LSIDRGQLDNLNPTDHGITFISDANLAWIMKNSSIKKRNVVSRWDFSFDESIGGRMDFNTKYTLPIRGLGDGTGDVIQYDQDGGFFLFEGNNVAYNVNNAGQFLWGHAMKQLGFALSSSWIESNGHALISSGGMDSEGDQKAIRHGYFYNAELEKTTYRFTQPWANWMPPLNISKPVSPDPGGFKDLNKFEGRSRRR